MYFVESADGYGVYGFIRDVIVEGEDANFFDRSGCYVPNWSTALDRYTDYKAKKHRQLERKNLTKGQTINSLRSALLSFYKKEGAQEYHESRKVNVEGQVVERQFQMPSRVFKSLSRNAELSDSGEEQDEQERKRHLSEVS